MLSRNRLGCLLLAFFANRVASYAVYEDTDYTSCTSGNPQATSVANCQALCTAKAGCTGAHGPSFRFMARTRHQQAILSNLRTTRLAPVLAIYEPARNLPPLRRRRSSASHSGAPAPSMLHQHRQALRTSAPTAMVTRPSTGALFSSRLRPIRSPEGAAMT